MFTKTTYTFTVLHRTDEPPDCLENALAESYSGHAVGMETACTQEPVSTEKIRDELIALGNDGGFFDYDLEDDA